MDEPEAERFARIAMNMGVPRENILIEKNSTNTGENVQFTRRLVEEQGLDLQTFILVQKPYMERRAFATFLRYWPDKRLIVTSPGLASASAASSSAERPCSPLIEAARAWT